MPHLVMSPQLFVLFSTLVEEASGILYGPPDQHVFASKLNDHVLDLGYSSLLDYYYRLRYDDPDGNEMRRLVETLAVHETYFFRELDPLVEIAEHLAATVRTRGRARVWSAACASGEEPYTLAMLLEERKVLDSVEIVATDISAAVIARAAAGRHSPRSLRDGYPQAIATRYLEASPQGVIVSPRIRGAVRFSRLNLLDAEGISRLGMFDAILCRNVLIYFRDERVLAIVEQLARNLGPDALLAVGVSESLLRAGTRLVCEERRGSFFYKRAV